MQQRDILKKYIEEDKLEQLERIIPPKYSKEISTNFTESLLQMSEQEILSFYASIMNNIEVWSVTKICGSIILLTSHIDDLLKKLVEKIEVNPKLRKDILSLDLHFIILFCVAQYRLPIDWMIKIMELKHFRNMIGHDFNGMLAANFKEAITPICKGSLLVIILTQTISQNSTNSPPPTSQS